MPSRTPTSLGAALNLDALLTQAFRQQISGEPQAALDTYKRVLNLQPRHTVALYNVGTIYGALGMYDAEEASYRQVLSIDPTFLPAMFNLAFRRDAAGDRTEAKALYRRIIELAPSESIAHFNLAFVLLAEGDRAEARKALDAALQLDPLLALRVLPGQFD